MYDSLSNDYDIPVTAPTLLSTVIDDHDYDIPQGSSGKTEEMKFICKSNHSAAASYLLN